MTSLAMSIFCFWMKLRTSDSTESLRVRRPEAASSAMVAAAAAVP